MRNRCFSQKGGRQGPNRTASERALVSCVKMWYTNGPLQNIALLSPFKLTVERPQLRPHAGGLHAKWSAGTAIPDAETREESRAEGADS